MPRPFRPHDATSPVAHEPTGRVDWEVPAWAVKGEAGEAQQTANLAAIVQEIVNQEGWQRDNALAFMMQGTRKRLFETFDGAFSPTLTVSYVPPHAAAEFARLLTAEEIEIVNAIDRTTTYNAQAEKNKAFDARDASFVISDSPWGIVTMRGDESQTGAAWVGGYVRGDKPPDASWDEWKNDPRNSSAFTIRALSATVSGLHFANVHDGIRMGKGGTDWTIEHVWGEYIRDDAVENDLLHSGKIVDSLFDGAYSGISTRPSASDTDVDGSDHVVMLDRVLLRLEASPYPYKYDERPEYVIDENGDPWDGSGIPYGHGSLFKYELNDPDRNPHFVIKDSVFVIPHANALSRISLPPAELIDELSNVTIVWLGEGEFRGALPTEKFPDQITILTGQQGRDFWKTKVVDWHERHPLVGAARKPDDPGNIEFPRRFD